MSPFAKTREDHQHPLPSAEEFAPRQYSFRSSAKTTAKVVVIAGSVLALFWMLDVLLA